MAFAAEPIQPTRVAVVNLARKPKPASLADPIAAATGPGSAEPPSPSENWATQVWTTLQTTFSNVAAAFRRFGE